MTTSHDTVTDRFAAGTEATLTITGKVIADPGHHHGRIVIEYLAGNGFPDRIAVDLNSTAVTAEPAPAPSDAEQERRDNIHALIRDSHLA